LGEVLSSGLFCSSSAADRMLFSAGLINRTLLRFESPLQEGETSKSLYQCKTKRFPALHGYSNTLLNIITFLLLL
jgi:hypothetical protein